MRAKLIAVIIASVAVVVVAKAQDMVEYSNLSAHGAKALGVRVGDSLTAPQKAAAKSEDASGPVIWEEKKSAQNKHQAAPPPAPVPPAVFILANGERLESTHYLLTVGSLRVQQGETQRTIPLSALNLDATIAANHERGIDLKVPTNKTQIMLGF
jgi:hypothetical protein